MKPWLIFLIAIMAAAVLFGLAALLSSCAPPLSISEPIVTHDSCDCIHITWETTRPTICKVSFCAEGSCYTNSFEDEYIISHECGLPVRCADSLTITAVAENGETCSRTFIK